MKKGKGPKGCTHYDDKVIHLAGGGLVRNATPGKGAARYATESRRNANKALKTPMPTYQAPGDADPENAPVPRGRELKTNSQKSARV
jgi:hypothetical protein